jgi:hypothetical protein
LNELWVVDTGTVLIAVALSAARPELTQLGIDVTLCLLEAGLLGPRRLGTAFTLVAKGLVLTRLAKALKMLAMEHPTAVLSTLDAMLPWLDWSQRGVFALLELAAELTERGAGTIPSPHTARCNGSTPTTPASTCLLTSDRSTFVQPFPSTLSGRMSNRACTPQHGENDSARKVVPSTVNTGSDSAISRLTIAGGVKNRVRATRPSTKSACAACTPGSNSPSNRVASVRRTGASRTSVVTSRTLVRMGG